MGEQYNGVAWSEPLVTLSHDAGLWPVTARGLAGAALDRIRELEAERDELRAVIERGRAAIDAAEGYLVLDAPNIPGAVRSLDAWDDRTPTPTEGGASGG